MSGEREGQQQFDLMSLPFAQLTTIKKQMEQEIEFLTSQYAALRMAHQKFGESKEALETVQPANTGKEVFIPMTSSMYVPGTLSDIKSIMVDIGTGYYVEKTVDDARDYFKRKEKFLGDQLAALGKNINEKRKNLEVLTEVMQAKLYEIQTQSMTNRAKAPVSVS